MKARKWSVYTLKDPRTDTVQYVGVTFHLYSRIRAHESFCELNKNPLRAWLVELGQVGMLPAHEVLETGTIEDRHEAEKLWIARFRSQGLELKNSTDGGLGCVGIKVTEEAKHKKRLKVKGVKKSEEFCQKLRDAFKHRTPEYYEKNAAILRERAKAPISDETRAKMAAAKAGKSWSKERRRAMEVNGHPNLGKKYSPERCAAISAALKGRERTPEERAKGAAGLRQYWENRAPEEKQKHIAALHQGRRDSAEGKIKQSQSLKRSLALKKTAVGK